jgi:hypothetical protein
MESSNASPASDAGLDDPRPAQDDGAGVEAGFGIPASGRTNEPGTRSGEIDVEDEHITPSGGQEGSGQNPGSWERTQQPTPPPGSSPPAVPGEPGGMAPYRPDAVRLHPDPEPEPEPETEPGTESESGSGSDDAMESSNTSPASNGGPHDPQRAQDDGAGVEVGFGNPASGRTNEPGARSGDVDVEDELTTPSGDRRGSGQNPGSWERTQQPAPPPGSSSPAVLGEPGSMAPYWPRMPSGAWPWPDDDPSGTGGDIASVRAPPGA